MGTAAAEAVGPGGEGGVEDFLASPADFPPGAVVDGLRGVQPDSGMAVLVVVVVEEKLAERAGLAGRRKGSGKDRAVFQRLIVNTSAGGGSDGGSLSAVLCERWRLLALRSRSAGRGSKPPRAALAEDRCGERRGKRRGWIASGEVREDERWVKALCR